MFVCINGRLFPKSKAKVSVFDHGYLYGDGIFETMRVYNGKVFLLTQHLLRMKNASKLLGIRIPQNKILKKWIMKTLRKNKLSSAYIRLSVSRGVGEIGVDAKCGSPNIVIITKKLKKEREIYEKGVKCKFVISESKMNIKSLSFLSSVLLKRGAKNYFEAIKVDRKGRVYEGAVSNIFIVKENVVITPPLELGILDGITRKTVLKIARKFISGEEKIIYKNDVLEADECFLTNSIKEIVPVVSISGKQIGNGKPGSISMQILREYRKLAYEK